MQHLIRRNMKTLRQIWSKNILPGTLTVAFVVVMSSLVSAQDCTTVTDDALVTTILGQIKSDSLLAPQMPHIVVGSVNRFVKLQGWTDTQRGYERLYSIVSNTSCVKAINVNNMSATPPAPGSPQRPSPSGGCAPGTKVCGEVCIPEGDTCSMKGKTGSD